MVCCQANLLGRLLYRSRHARAQESRREHRPLLDVERGVVFLAAALAANRDGGEVRLLFLDKRSRLPEEGGGHQTLARPLMKLGSSQGDLELPTDHSFMRALFSPVFP